MPCRGCNFFREFERMRLCHFVRSREPEPNTTAVQPFRRNGETPLAAGFRSKGSQWAQGRRGSSRGGGGPIDVLFDSPLLDAVPDPPVLAEGWSLG